MIDLVGAYARSEARTITRRAAIEAVGKFRGGGAGGERERVTLEEERGFSGAGGRGDEEERFMLAADVEEKEELEWSKSLKTSVWLSLVLTQRQGLSRFQDWQLVLASLGRHAFVGVFYGILWWHVGDGEVSERVGILFFSLVFIMLSNQQNIPYIFQDRLQYYREKGAGVYGEFPYWWSITLAQVPLAVLNSVIYSSLVYWMCGLNNSDPGRFGYFTGVMILSNLVALSFCQMLASFTRLEETAVALFPVALFSFIAFGGFIVRLPTLPEYLRAWAPTISFVRWALQGLVVNEFEGNDRVFPIPEAIPVTPDEVFRSFLAAYGFDNGISKLTVLPILVANLFVFRVLTLMFLRLVNFEKR
ncbi:unnamed protein product [Discosporangium mesarthrocarpum]